MCVEGRVDLFVALVEIGNSPTVVPFKSILCAERPWDIYGGGTTKPVVATFAPPR